MRRSWAENSILGAFDNAYSEISELGEDMRDVFDRTPEHFKENSGRERGIAADILEAVLQPSVPASIAKEHIGWLEMRKGKDGKLFRPARLGNIVRCLKAGLAVASRISDGSRDMVRFVEDTKIDIHNLETIHFPGMAGR